MYFAQNSFFHLSSVQWVHKGCRRRRTPLRTPRLGKFRSSNSHSTHQKSLLYNAEYRGFFIEFKFVKMMNNSLLHRNQLQRRGEVISCYPGQISACFVHVFYFIALSLLGSLILGVLTPKTDFKLPYLDLIFTAVSAATVSSMSAVEMEAFSDLQLIVLAVLMFLGGEVFVSMVGLLLRNLKNEPGDADSDADDDYYDEFGSDSDDLESGYAFQITNPFLHNDALNYLISCIWKYIIVVHFLGVALLFFYLTLNHSAAAVLKLKGLKTSTFAVFTVISSFSNCGFVPTNENLILFRENSGLQLILIPQILLGNTLFPFCLRILLHFHRSKKNREETDYLLKNTNKIDYFHLLPSLHSLFLTATVLGFILIGFLLFCALEWNSPFFNGLNPYRKIISILFETINARFSGETVINLSEITPALLVFFIVMMYLPPYTSFFPIRRDDETEKKQTSGMGISDKLVFSQLSYIAIFVVVICITERTRMETDPVNFSVLNITLEVISAYGNVGFTSGYSCEKRLIQDEKCVNRWYGFVGEWSNEGKIVLIIVMFFGRLKQFSMNGGRAWKLL